MPHSLTWGSLTLAEPDTLPDPDGGYIINALSDSTLGNPSAIVEIVQSLLTDGALARVQGWGNRDAVIRLRISSGIAFDAGPALAAAEAALMANVLSDSPPPLVWTPPATSAATTVFDVVVATLERDNSDGWDVNESLYEYRYFLLTLTCLPFARAEEKVTVPALAANPGSETTSTIDACTSATNWSKTAAEFTASSGPTVVAGAIEASADDASSGGTLSLVRTAAASMAALPYLRVAAEAYRTSAPNTLRTPSFMIDGVPAHPIAVAVSAIAGKDYYFETGDFTTLEVAVGAPGGAAYSDVTVSVADITATDTIPGLPRQRPRSVAVAGSAPATAALRVYDDTPDELGHDILIYTSRSDFAPNLRGNWYVAGATSGASTNMSESASIVVNGGTDLVFRIPVSALTPGTYALMANVQVASDADLMWTIRLTDAAGAAVLGSDVEVAGTVDLPGGGGGAPYSVTALDSLALPPVMAEGDQYVEITFTNSTANNVVVDEVWLFNLDEGALTWVKDPTTLLRWVEIRSPELGAPNPAVYGSESDDGANAADVSYLCESFGVHRFDPGLMQVFTATENSENASSEIEFYRRFHSHVQA